VENSNSPSVPLTFSFLLQNPELLGAGLLAAGALIFLIFVLPSLIFPEEEPSVRRLDAETSRPVSQEQTLSFARLEETFRRLSSGVGALEAASRSPASAPPPEDVRRLSQGLDGLKARLEEVRALTAPFSAGTHSQDNLLREVDQLAGRLGGLIPPDGKPGPAVPDAAWAERRAFMAQNLQDALRAAAERRRADTERAARRQGRIERRLERWRRAWRDRLERREALLGEETARILTALAEAGERRDRERARILEGRANLENGRTLLEGEKTRLAETVQRAEEERAVAEKEILAFEEKAQSLVQEIEKLEALRKEEAAAASDGVQKLRGQAREDARAWREKLTGLEKTSAIQRLEEENKLATVLDEAKKELDGLQSSLVEEEAGLKRDKKDLQDRARAAAEKTVEESRRALSVRADRWAEVESVAAKRREAEEALRKEKEDFAREAEAVRSWAAGRRRTLEALLARALGQAQTALDSARAERERREAELSSEKESLRQDIGLLRSKGEAELAARRELLETAARAHESRLEALRLEEEELRTRSVALGREAERLKEQAEKEHEKAQVRLARRRAAHEKVYIEAKTLGEARVTAAAREDSEERTEAATLEKRLAVRRRRFDALRERRRRAADELVRRAQVALDEALAAQRDAEARLQDRVLSAESRGEEDKALRDRLKALPRLLAQTESSATNQFKQEASLEMVRISEDIENRWEALKESAALHHGALGKLRDRLSDAEKGLLREETDFQNFLAEVRGQIVFLDGLRRFFAALRLPAETSVKSEVA